MQRRPGGAGGDRRRALRIGAGVWAVIGAAVAAAGLGQVNADARLLVGAAAVAGPGAAVAAAALLRSPGRERFAGALLAASAVLTPTWFAYPVALPALAAGVALVVAPHAVVGGPRRSSRRRIGDPARSPA